MVSPGPRAPAGSGRLLLMAETGVTVQRAWVQGGMGHWGHHRPTTGGGSSPPPPFPLFSQPSREPSPVGYSPCLGHRGSTLRVSARGFPGTHSCSLCAPLTLYQQERFVFGARGRIFLLKSSVCLESWCRPGAPAGLGSQARHISLLFCSSLLAKGLRAFSPQGSVRPHSTCGGGERRLR